MLHGNLTFDLGCICHHGRIPCCPVRRIRLRCTFCAVHFAVDGTQQNPPGLGQPKRRANRRRVTGGPTGIELVSCSCMSSIFPRTTRFPEHRLAWLVAIAADAIQIVGLPFFVEGVLSPVDALLDVIVAVVLTRLLGWHWAFLPGIVSELIPGLNLFPTWTAAVFYVTSRRVLQDRASR